MPHSYSQSRALWAITRASFKAIFAHPSAIIFSILFPVIFVLIFGAFGNTSGVAYRVAVAPGSDTNNVFYQQGLRNASSIRIVSYRDSDLLNQDLIKGKLTAILSIKEHKDSYNHSHYTVHTHSTTASSNTLGGFMGVLDYTRLKFESAASGTGRIVNIEEPEVTAVRKYKAIDFILPGQLGFSILFSTLFGIAFTFFNLREQLVLKRFYASPVNRINILIGVGISRLFFQVLSVVVLVLFGHYVLDFTLVHGLLTFLEIVVMTLIMLFLLMGVGLIFSSVVKTDTSIPLLINLFGFPQMMLSGTFFPIEVFPKWLQEICKLLPLTQYNDALRKISFEGLHITDCWKQIGILGIWIMVTYIIVARVLKWE
jgi:ABC-2 type transport system permease protein